jgi:hypothetical protein
VRGLSGSAGMVAICAEVIAAPPLGSPISFAAIFRFAKSAQFSAALAGDHAAAIRIAPGPHTNAVFNLSMGISPQSIVSGAVIFECAVRFESFGSSLPESGRLA